MPANRYGVARHSSSKVVKSSKGDTAIEYGMRLHVTKTMEWDCCEDLKTWADSHGNSCCQAVMITQSALVTRYVMRWAPVRWGMSPEIEKDWKLYSIVVQSPLLRRVLESMHKYYFGDIPRDASINTTFEHVELRAPFNISLKERLEDAVRKEQDPETKKHLSLLCNVLEEETSGNTKKMIKANAANGITYFEDLPLMFTPGTILFTDVEVVEGQQQLFRVRGGYDRHAEEGSSSLALACSYFDWHGTSTRLSFQNTLDLYIHEFEGPMAITDLPFYPLVYHPLRSEVEQRLTSRGKKFEAHKGYHYRAYNGIGFDIGFDTEVGFERNVNSRVIIDAAASWILNPEAEEFRQTLVDEPDWDSKSLGEERLRFCPATLRAYSMNDKRWLQILVDEVKDIE